MKFTTSQVVADSATKIPAEATGGTKGYTTPAAIAGAMPANALTIAQVSGLQAIINNLNAKFTNVKIINNKSDLPTPALGVITLDPNVTYIITDTIDLTGDRLETSGTVNLFGYSSEVSFITSTDLDPGVPLLTSEHTIVVKNITFHDVDTCLAIDGNTNLVALDWEHVNFVNIPHVGIIDSCDNFILNTSAFLGAQDLLFTGTIGTVGLNNSLFRGLNSAGSIFRLDASTVITRRFRIIYSSIIVPAAATGINIDAAASIPTEAYILDTVNFSGAGTYLTGVTYTSEKALFRNCVGTINTTAIANMFMKGNVIPTDILVPGDFYQVAGITETDGQNQKFTHILARNAMRYDSTIPRLFRIQCTFSETAPNNNIIGFYIGVKKGGGTHTPVVDRILESEVYVTSNGTRPDIGVCQALVFLEQNDEVYLITENETSVGDVTVSYFNMIIERTN
jgi:hypothetical protein